jgi:hypothetical protein
VEGKGRAKDIQVVNKFIDEHEAELLEIFEKAQRGEFIKKVQN